MPQISPSTGPNAASACPVWSSAARLGATPGMGVEARRRRLLRSLREVLGPSQFQHTTAHCEQVARTAAHLARLMRLDGAQIAIVRLAGLLHDLGKALIPDSLLAKPGPLTRAEREVMNRHADDGARLCEALGADAATADAVRHHHTRFDAGPAPLAAQVVSVADALVTMTTDRPYSSARSFAEALGELRLGRGTVFNPDAVVAAHILGAASMSRAA
jgi:putative nucleotidyltransferase with HDIG domain